MTGPLVQVLPFGDHAFLIETADVAGAHRLADLISRGAVDLPPDTIDEVVVGYAVVVVVVGPDPGAVDPEACAAWLEGVVSGFAVFDTRPEPGTRSPVTHLLPVVFDGDDLDEVAGLIGASRHRVVELLVGAHLEVAFVGFAPGFPYLTGLPPELAGLHRRHTPRTAVPAGSVAVAGGFASIYPRSTPGGWHLLGRTTEILFDPDVPPYSRVSPGDHVRFHAVDAPAVRLPVASATASSAAAAAITDPARVALDPGDGPALLVVDPGLLSIVEDGGRRAVARLGVPAAGAADRRALALVNLLLGNERGAAAIECTASGPTLRVIGDGHIAVVGAAQGAVDVRVDGREVADATVVPVADGQVVSIGRIRHGLLSYLGIAGGLLNPEHFGSRSSDVLTGLGSGPLRAGNRLDRGRPGRIRGHLTLPSAPPPGTPVTLRVVPGPRVVPGTGSEAALEVLASTVWDVAHHVDRIGVRLSAEDGTTISNAPAGSSTPMITGAVQVPPDGLPIILLPDHATVGGYPVAACVITADIPLLGQLTPGDQVAFVVVDQAEAAHERRRSWGRDRAVVSGWFPTSAGT